MSALAITLGIFANFIVGAYLAHDKPPKDSDAIIFLIALVGMVYFWVSLVLWLIR